MVMQPLLFTEKPLSQRAKEWLRRLPASEERDYLIEMLDEQAPKAVVRTIEIAELISYPAGMNTAEVRAAVARWVAYQRRDKRRKLSDPRKYVEGLLNKFSGQADLFVAAVAHSIEMGYLGLYPPNQSQPKALTGTRFSKPAIRGDI